MGPAHSRLSRPLQRTRSDGLRGVRKGIYLIEGRVPSAEVETADLETTLGIWTNGDKGRVKSGDSFRD